MLGEVAETPFVVAWAMMSEELANFDRDLWWSDLGWLGDQKEVISSQLSHNLSFSLPKRMRYMMENDDVSIMPC